MIVALDFLQVFVDGSNYVPAPQKIQIEWLASKTEPVGHEVQIPFT